MTTEVAMLTCQVAMQADTIAGLNAALAWSERVVADKDAEIAELRAELSVRDAW